MESHGSAIAGCSLRRCLGAEKDTPVLVQLPDNVGSSWSPVEVVRSVGSLPGLAMKFAVYKPTESLWLMTG